MRSSSAAAEDGLVSVHGNGNQDNDDIESRTERTQSIDSQRTDISRFSLDGVRPKKDLEPSNINFL